jgi:hypothetical protein
MNSLRFFTGRSGCTTYRLGTLETSVMVAAVVASVAVMMFAPIGEFVD